MSGTWFDQLDVALTERHQAQVAPFTTLIAVYNEALHREEALLDRIDLLEEQLGRAERKLSSAESELERFSGTHSGDPRRQAELEQQCARLKEERTELYRAQSSNTQRLLDLNEQLKDKDGRVLQLEAELKALQAERAKWERRHTDQQNLIHEKNLNIQVIQDELTALQLELMHTDDRLKELMHTPPPNHTRHLDVPSELSRTMQLTPEPHQATCTAMAGNRIAIAMVGWGVGVWAVEEGDWSLEVRLQVEGVDAMAMNDALLLAAHHDGLSLFNLTTGRIRAALLPRPSLPIRSMALTAQHAIVIDAAGALRIWHLERLLLLRSLEGPYHRISNLALCHEAGIEVWLSLEQLQAGGKPKQQRKMPYVSHLLWIADDLLLAAEGSTVHGLNGNLASLFTLTVPTRPKLLLATGDYLACSDGQMVWVWRRSDPKNVAAILSSTTRILDIHSHGRALLTVHTDGTVGVWK